MSILPPIRRLFPPKPGVVLRNKGVRRRRVLTADGSIELSRRYFWAAEARAQTQGASAGMYPMDESAGIDQQSVSPGAREILCRMGMIQDFAQASEDARRIGNVPVSKERLRVIVEAQAARVQRSRHAGDLPASWTAAQAKAGGSDNGSDKTRVYCGIDGVMVPMVTRQEKDKRRKAHCIRRQQRSAAGVGNLRPLPPARRGSDERFREMKIGLFYDQDKAHRHAFATAERHEGFRPLLAGHAGQIRFQQAHESITLTDGAKWIMGAICAVMSDVSMTLLDFYHLSQQVHDAAKVCLGETAQARQWAKAGLEELRTTGVATGVAAVLARIAALNRRLRSPVKKDRLRRLREYILSRLEMLDYPTALARNWDIGSGPTEAMCKSLTLRLKRPGMKWDADHASAMMNLIAMYESGQAKNWWSSRQAA